jgi:hypothetical protein
VYCWLPNHTFTPNIFFSFYLRITVIQRLLQSAPQQPPQPDHPPHFHHQLLPHAEIMLDSRLLLHQVHERNCGDRLPQVPQLVAVLLHRTVEHGADPQPGHLFLGDAQQSLPRVLQPPVEILVIIKRQFARLSQLQGRVEQLAAVIIRIL